MKRLIVPTLALAALLTVGVMGTTAVQAQEANGSTFAQRIADHFGLNQDDVESFLQESRQERKALMQEKHQEHIDELVANGILTQAQADELQAIHEAWIQSKENGQDLSREERQAQREAHRAEIEAWAAENGIDLSDIRPDHAGPGMHKFSLVR